VAQVSAIENLIKKAESVLVVISRPVDPDCIGTGLAVHWWLEQQGKRSQVVSFSPIPETMQRFPDSQRICCEQSKKFPFDHWQAIMLIDGSSWIQFFGKHWHEVLSRLDPAVLSNIDHHEPDDICAAIPDRCLNQRTSSTAQLFYEAFLSQFSIQPPAFVVNYLYRALLYDTRNFRNEPHEGMYRFAEELMRLGADHEQAVEVMYDPREFEFLVWALGKTQYYPEIATTLLQITAADARHFEQRLGREWMELDSIYKEVFLRNVAGYDYGLILTDNQDGTVKLSWRTRSRGKKVSIAICARRAGFAAGGHYNAGGGLFQGTLTEAKRKLIAALREEVNKQQSLQSC